ncbi:MAG: hypothetical protein KF819_33350 [Labilithrix sp.]|nr:hypothetical protein [Labilithrix sp.]
MLSYLSSPRAKRYLRVVVLVLGLLFLRSWQYGFEAKTAEIDTRFKQTAATGINMEAQFVFFLHHLGLFPLATNAPIRADTKEEALRQLREEVPSLKQDHGSTFRAGGDRGRTYLYLVDVYLNGDAIKPRLQPAHMRAFTLALCMLFTAFWWMRRSPQGFILCLILGSNPFQLFVIHRQENVFSWPITVMILLLSINIPLMTPKLPKAAWYPTAAAIASGVAMAVVRTFRSEPTPMLLSVVLVYVTVTALSRVQRAKLVGILAVAFTITSFGTVRFLDAKLARSKATVAAAGGDAYTGPVVHNHLFWHPVFCGLGDFDKKYGYAWNDNVAYAYALPFLKQRHPHLDKLAPRAVQSWFYDAHGKYPILFEEVDGYNELIRDKVIADIRKDPGWYFDILKKRTWRILTETTPVGIATSSDRVQLEGSALGVLCVPLAIFLALSRRWFMLKLLAFSLPLSIGAFMVFSGGGMAYYGCFHQFGAFIFGVLAFEGARSWYRGRRRMASSTG